MKLQTFKYFLKDGFNNIFINKTMAAASISIVVAALTVVGIFFTITLNITYISKQIEDVINIRIYVDKQREDILGIIEYKIKTNPYIESYKFISSQQALEEFKKQLGKRGYLLEGFEKDNPLRPSFEVKLKKLEYAEKVKEDFLKTEGVGDVYCPSDTINKLKNLNNLIKLICSVLIIALFIVAVFIISNAIKLTMIARRREISIMKYIGATNWFIRWPFVIEGFIIGIIGAMLSLALVIIIYNWTVNYISYIITFVSFVDISEFKRSLLALYVLIGGFIGVVGSIVSIRRYLKV